MLPGTVSLVVIPPTCQLQIPSPHFLASAPLSREFNAIITGLEYQARRCQCKRKTQGSYRVLTARLKQTGLSVRSTWECWCFWNKGQGYKLQQSEESTVQQPLNLFLTEPKSSMTPGYCFINVLLRQCCWDETILHMVSIPQNMGRYATALRRLEAAEMSSVQYWVK